MSSLAHLGPGLLVTEGAQHRKQRKMLTPVFSIAYLRNVTPLFYETSHKVSIYHNHPPSASPHTFNSFAMLFWPTSRRVRRMSTC